MLAETDALHGTVSDTTTRNQYERAFKLHGYVRFERLSGISNGHLFNLRQHTYWDHVWQSSIASLHGTTNQ